MSKTKINFNKPSIKNMAAKPTSTATASTKRTKLKKTTKQFIIISHDVKIFFGAVYKAPTDRPDPSNKSILTADSDITKIIYQRCSVDFFLYERR